MIGKIDYLKGFHIWEDKHYGVWRCDRHGVRMNNRDYYSLISMILRKDFKENG